MAPTDPLIRWETEAIRESEARRHSPKPDESLQRTEAASRGDTTPAATPTRDRRTWVTLRDAHYETGLPVETIRKWARRDHVPSEIRLTDFGERRMVDLGAVEQRARKLGRTIAPIPLPHREPPSAPPPATPPSVIDLREVESEGRHESTSVGAHAAPGTAATVVDVRLQQPDATEAPPHQAAEATTPRPAAPHDTAEQDPGSRDGVAPPETMIIPIAAWDRMLMQLGNLHQAGQQLAEARERAAKAETESKFLRERLSDLREELDRARQEAVPDAPGDEPFATEVGPADEPKRFWRFAYRGRRDRRR